MPSSLKFNYEELTHQGHGLNFNELMHGRIQMMTALCLALAHTYQTMSRGLSLEQLKKEAFRLPKAQEKVPYAAQLPNYYQTDW